MAILIDFSQVVLSSCYVFSEQLNKNQLAQQSAEGGRKRAENIIRHVILSQLLAIKKKFGKSYGDLVICCDAPFGKYWRKNEFPYYKANRKKAREDSALDFGMIFDIAEHIIEDLEAFFPYKVVRVVGAEADDVIGTIVQKAQYFGNAEKFLIVSEDQDYVQLQQYPNVAQYRPRQKKMLVEKQPIAYLQEKIIRGDKGDGIPNVLSEADTFVTGKKQKAVTKDKLKGILDNFVLYTEEGRYDDPIFERMRENQRLIDLGYIPNDLQEQIMNDYNVTPKGTAGTIFNYLMSHGCTVLLQHVQEF